MSGRGSAPRRGRPRRSRRCSGLALALLALGCDQRFYFDVPAALALADSGANAATVRCSSDPECGLPSLHCDVTLGRCFECVVDEDCGEQSRHRCDSALHRCVECKVERDCPAGSRCDPTMQRCIRSCVEEVDCALADHGCDERRGVCIQCDDDRECATSEGSSYCAFDGTGCVQCRVDSHCGAGSVCDPLLGRCVSCRDSGDCAPGSYCDPGAYQCVAPRVSSTGP